MLTFNFTLIKKQNAVIVYISRQRHVIRVYYKFVIGASHKIVRVETGFILLTILIVYEG